MARIRTDKKTGSKRLTISWTSDRYATQEHILSQFQRSGDLREFIMNAVLIAQAAQNTGLIPRQKVEQPPQEPIQKVESSVSDALKKFKL